MYDIYRLRRGQSGDTVEVLCHDKRLFSRTLAGVVAT